MKRILSMTAALGGLAVAASALPAAAQYANEFVPAKLTKQGVTTVAIAGSGTVVVQVQVNADGTAKAIKVIRSTNAADNAAAMDIANTSTYRPARKGTTPVVSFYDFTLKFNGKSVAQSTDLVAPGSDDSGPAKAAEQKIAGLIGAKQYAQAKSAAQTALFSTPTDEIRSLLGVADAQLGQFTDAAVAFDHVGTIAKPFHTVAAQSYASAAVALAGDNATQALAYAQKAFALDPGGNTQYALGVAQLANKQYADAITSLKAAHDKVFADANAPKNSKLAIDSSLMTAYAQSGDAANAQATATEIKTLDPASTLPGRVMGIAYLQSGDAALTAKDNATALKDFDLAIAQGDPEVSVTAAVQAAFVVVKGDKPDYKQMQAYADKALAIKPDSPEGNFAEGIALWGQYQSGSGAHDDAAKKKAVDALNKADELAKAAGNVSLSLQIEGFIKTNVKPAAGGGGPSGGGR
jgi:TonB family protein